MTRPEKSRRRIFFEYWLPVLMYAALIATLSAQPRLKPPLTFVGADKWMHLFEYGGLGFFLARALRVSLPRRDPLVVGFWVLGFGLVMAIGDEVLQSFVPGRHSSRFDVMADMAGLLVAMIFYMAFTRD